ncbi:GUN4 domain-containing protein [Microcoleus sp. T3_A4]|uniref:GUN4 domain-containing protein n=1 Tax=Microcoleus sp. T3_A4 TaxID=2818968 RepID=UPI002FD28ECD
MNDRAKEVNSTFWGYVQNSTVVTASGNVQIKLTNGTVLSVRQEDWADFSDLIARVTQRLVGRGFIFEKVADFIQNNSCGYFRLIADAGLGKTAIAAELTKRYRAPACFVSANENRTQPERILNILSTQLIARYTLPHMFLPMGAGKTSDWFYGRLKEAASNPEGLPVVVVIDAIDEADVPPPACNWLYLPKNLPKGVYVILTHRPGDYLLTTDPGVRVEEQIITWDDPLQQRDIELYLPLQVKRPEIREVLENATPTVTQNQFIAKLQEASQGNFMYLEYVMDSITSGEAGFTPLNLNKLPQGLTSYYAQFWAGMEAVRCKEGWDEWSRLYRPVIELLGVALEPVSVEWFADHVDRQPDEIRDRALQVWRRFLNKEQHNNRETWRLIHQSFANFLQEKVESKATHRRLVEYYLAFREEDSYKKHQGYAARHLSIHLTEAGLWKEKATQIANHKWLAKELIDRSIDDADRKIVQLGKYNVNIGEGPSIQIGDRIYQDPDVGVIREIVLNALLREECTRLKNLLAAGRWREANDTTRIIVLKAANAEKEGWLSDEQIQNFPCPVLQIIDNLWLQYSDRRFGFSVQKRIFNECEKNPQVFGDRVGWCIQNTWISASQVIHTPANAPDGHLPWGIVQVVTLDNAALDAFVVGLRTGAKMIVQQDWQKQLLADFMAFTGSFIGDRVDKEEFKRDLEYELSHDQAWWKGKRLEELKVAKLFSLLAACSNL